MDLRDVVSEYRYEQDFADGEGQVRIVFADYAVRGDTRVLLHVEADPALRGTGASGRFMQALAEHARAQRLKLYPQCGYARTWLQRHPEFKDVSEF
ncbi:GNAT family N-acetyltransferase [Brevundimonas sp.]|uniref:GNAT family N-acetyltransferase n=1 Tax=Brevundimonas sp. TaxID=1871086 RepID=UPI0028A2AFD5|nr:GNAT family N-acetyltransferase [Brevundimonas sp.]